MPPAIDVTRASGTGTNATLMHRLFAYEDVSQGVPPPTAEFWATIRVRSEVIKLSGTDLCQLRAAGNLQVTLQSLLLEEPEREIVNLLQCLGWCIHHAVCNAEAHGAEPRAEALSERGSLPPAVQY